MLVRHAVQPRNALVNATETRESQQSTTLGPSNTLENRSPSANDGFSSGARAVGLVALPRRDEERIGACRSEYGASIGELLRRRRAGHMVGDGRA